MYSADKRWTQVGELLVNYAAAVNPGERVMIAMGELESFPLVQAVYEAVLKSGGFPQVQFLSETLRHSLLKYGNPEQIRWIPEIEAYGMEWADVYFGLRGAFNLREYWDIPTDRLSVNQAAQGKVSSLRWEKTRWCLVRVPNANFAEQAGTDLETITDMFFHACLRDWQTEGAQWRRQADQLEKTSTIRIVGREIDLTSSVQGRKWIVGDGKMNMPDGEIFTSPIPESIEGEISFEFPGVLSGRLVHDIHLCWKQGHLREAWSSSNDEFLEAILNTDPGASSIGEFGIGTNPAVTIFCVDILIDEKIGGTAHIALGRAYPDCGGTNQSAIHWDIVKDLRTEGAVYADGKPVLEKGVLLI